MNKSDLIQAHKHSSLHREEILRSELCGCFYCLAVFEPDAIGEWIDEEMASGRQPCVQNAASIRSSAPRAGFQSPGSFSARCASAGFKHFPLGMETRPPDLHHHTPPAALSRNNSSAMGSDCSSSREDNTGCAGFNG